MILPGATLGVLGGGQLGRMFTVAARTLGYRVIVLDPDPESPTATLADEHLRAGYDDRAALRTLARRCAAITTEFENVPADSLAYLAQQGAVVRPRADAVGVAQDRIREKTFFRDHGLPVAPFAAVHHEQELPAALDEVGVPALLKRSRFGYDGKGQARVNNIEEAQQAFAAFDRAPCLLEPLLPLYAEVSVVLARSADGDVASFPVAENEHRHGVLDLSIVPARVPQTLADEATAVARRLAERLDYCGVLAVEFFVLREGNRLRLTLNEVAPRPHNSGHYTLDACITSQFEQQARALCGLPLGDTRLVMPAVMVNLLGDVWHHGDPAWERVLAHPQAKLHLYGKREARPGRKMGHYTCLAESVDAALQTALLIKGHLSASPPVRHAERG